jgi:hypothetical protein
MSSNHLTPTVAAQAAPQGAQPVVELRTVKAEAVRRPARWYLKRTVLGIAIMVATVAAGAWVFHSTIEAEAGDGSKFGTYAD